MLLFCPHFCLFEVKVWHPSNLATISLLIKDDCEDLVKNMSKVTEEEIQDFINTWSNQGREVADKQIYWDSLLEILGVPSEQIKNKSYIEYEKPVILRKNDNFRGYIDAYIKPTKVLIEQKSNGVDLFKPEDRPNRGDTKKLTPFRQANRYNSRLGKK